MDTHKGRMRRLGADRGFTLLEMLIAVVILGILAMIIIPQFTASTDDAKSATVKADLSALRSAIETYYQQHNGSYPGVMKTDGTAGDATSCATAFGLQLTQYSLIGGVTGPDKADAGKFPANSTIYGPYVKGGSLPVNPFNNKADVVCDNTVTDITTRAADGNTGWKFYMKTGILIANDNLSSGGTAHSAY
jgi:general secretion pathway protein G